jgi:hypothetical protein
MLPSTLYCEALRRDMNEFCQDIEMHKKKLDAIKHELYQKHLILIELERIVGLIGFVSFVVLCVTIQIIYIKSRLIG